MTADTMRTLMKLVEGEERPTRRPFAAFAADHTTLTEAVYRAYHGTSTKFRTFKVQKARHVASYRLGFYFSDSARYAETYALMRDGAYPRVIEVNLTLNNPFITLGMNAVDLISKLPVPDLARRELRSGFRGDSFSHYALLETCVRFGLRDALVAQGHDGIIYEEGHAPAYIVFDASQIEIIGEKRVPK